MDLARVLVCSSLIGVVSLSAIAREDEPSPEPPASPAAEEADDEGGLGDLDDLLGIGDGDDDDGASASEDADALPTADEIEVERALTEQEARDALVQAAQQMGEASFRMREVGDSGVVTQRLHNEIIDKLDVLIRFAEQQQQSSSSSSSSSSSQQQQQQQNQQNQQQQQGQRQGQQQSEQQGGASDRDDGISDIPFEEGARDVIDSTSAGWGDLPARVRERLVEGSSDYFSGLYEALTEAYYRRLAEEASK